MFIALAISLLSTANAATCPVHEFVGQANTNSTVWYDDVTGYYTWTGVAAWQVSPYSDDPTTTHWSDVATGVAAASSAEWFIGTKDNGALGAFGYNVTTGLPSGASDYWSLDSGNTGRFVGIGDGTVVAWGSTTSYTPITGTYTVVAAGRDLVCAGSDTANVGLVCSGDNTEKMLSLMPTTGNVISVDVSRYIVAYVLDDNTLHIIKSAKATGAALTVLTQFAANAPTTGVQSVEIYGGAGGSAVGIAWMTDGTATVWQDGGGLTYALKSAPGFEAYGSSGLKSFKPRGPSGEITFVGQPHTDIYAYGNQTAIGAVFADAKGLVLGTHTFAAGDAVRWGDTSISYYPGTTAHYWPRLMNYCY